MNYIDRRRFLLSFAGLFGIGVLSPILQGARDDENELSIDFSAPGFLIPENFLGFSFETAALLSDGILLPENHSFFTRSAPRHNGRDSNRGELE
jgi:hypothetical protein